MINRRPDNPMAVRTYDEVARMMGITRQRVQQLERSALNKMRLALRRLGYNHAGELTEDK